MTVVAIIFVLVFAGYVFKNDGWRIFRTNRYGTEAEAYVNRIEKVSMRASGTGYAAYADFTCYRFYVTFQAENGLPYEARLLNPRKWLTTGSRIRIEYLNEQAADAVLTEIMEVSPVSHSSASSVNTAL